MNYRPRGAQLRLKDVIARMQNKPKVHKPVTYSTQEIDAAKAVLVRLLATANNDGRIYSTKQVITENSDDD